LLRVTLGEARSALRPARVLTRPIACGLLLHPLEAFVVVGELLHVRQRDLSRDDRVVSTDISLRIVRAVLELHVYPLTELVELETVPIAADLVTHAPRFFDGNLSRSGHPESFPRRRPLSIIPGAAPSSNASVGQASTARRAWRSVAPATGSGLTIG
jgi:hypothetical protein